MKRSILFLLLVLAIIDPCFSQYLLSIEDAYLIGTATVDSFNNKIMVLDLENYVTETSK